MTKKDIDWTRLAEEYHASEECELDADVAISIAEDGSGAWVRAWVWVPAPETGPEEAARAPK